MGRVRDFMYSGEERMKETNVKRRKPEISIRVQYTIFIVGILALVIVAVCALTATQLEPYSISVKQSRILEAVEEIKNCVKEDFDDDSLDVLERKMRSSNLDTVILGNINDTPQVLFATDLRQSGSANALLDFVEGNLELDEKDIYEENDSYILYRAYNQRLNSYQIDCAGHVGEDVWFIITTPLESIRESVVLSTRFMMALGLLAIAFGGLFIFLATRSLTSPILELSRISEEMADQHFDVRYEGKQRNEIGVLGENINHMSESLERAITDLKSANRQLERDLKEKEELDQMRRLFLSNVSHELKTPIALIQGYAEGLMDGITDDPESTAFYCEVIVDEAQKMNQIVKRLLSLDQIESGQMEMTPEVFNLSEMIRGVAQSTRMLAGEKQCELKLDLVGDVMVYADQFMTEGILQNYLSNAWHYVSDPGVVTVKEILQGDRVVVSVHDTGDPIPEADLEHIWDKFYKVDKARTRSYGGSGIGLSIVRALINAQGERCGAINRDGGVDFWFELKLADRDIKNHMEPSDYSHME